MKILKKGVIRYLLILSTVLLGIFLSFGQDTIYFQSANPFSFYDIITDLDNQEKQQVYGVLTLPDGFKSTTQYPVIIAVAGSNGWSDHHHDYLNIYRKNGIATFELCSFQSRGVKSTVGSQTQVTTAMMVLDSYRAFEMLADIRMIKKSKIAITGWSLGGGVSLFSAWSPLKNAINSNIVFAAHLPIYPPCIVTPSILDFGASPIHILIGELDNWTPSDACVDLVNKLEKNTNIDLTIYPNAHHSFDRLSPLKIQEKGYILEDCRFEMNKNGAVLMNFFKIPMINSFLQKMGLFICAKRGPTYGGNYEAREKALIFSKEFMLKHLY